MKAKASRDKVSVLLAVPPTCDKRRFLSSSCVPGDAFHSFLANKIKTQGPKPKLRSELCLAAADMGHGVSRSSDFPAGQAPVGRE